MRIKVELYSERKQKLNLNYFYYLSSYIYNQLQNSDQNYSKMLHDKGYTLHNRTFKMFTFSQLMPDKFVRDGDSMILDGKITWYVTSPIKDFIINFADSITSSEYMRIGNCELKICRISIMKPINFTRNMNFISLSPIVVTTGRKVDGKIKPETVSVEDSKFASNIKNNILKKYYVLNGTIPDDLSFNIKFKNIEKYSRGKLIKFKNTYLKGYQLPFAFEGNPELIKVAYESGIGEDNSGGMGYIERA